MTVLTLDAALDGCSAAVVRDGSVLAMRRQAGGRGSAAALPLMARDVLAEAGMAAAELAGIAVTVGPGSFTGVRAALALAHGIGLGGGVPVWGVSVGDAVRAAGGAMGRPVWVAVDSRRGRVFLDGGGPVASVALDDLPLPEGPVAVAGDAAIAVMSRLAARGADVLFLGTAGPTPLGIAAAPRGPALPLYVDAPEARPGPAGRPAPQ